MKTLLLHGLALGVGVGAIRRLAYIHMGVARVHSGECELSGILDLTETLSSISRTLCVKICRRNSVAQL
jgi:hypothetical protein